MITEPPFVEILSALQQRCPNLEALKLFRASCSNNSEGYISLVPRTCTVSEYFRTANLRFLSTSLSVFNELDDLGDLGLVSQVERLEILSSQYGHSPSEVPSFHGVEWPNLRYLSLYLSYDIDLFCYLWAAPSLVASLTSFKLQIKDLLAGGADDKAETVASLLAERSPKLKEVAFYGPPPEQLRSRFDPAPLIRMLPKLPVQKLQVDVRGVEATPPCLSQRLSGQIFPSIQSLDVGSYGVELGELESLAMNLPNLTYLRIKIGISGNEGGEVARPTSGEQAFELRVSYLTLDSLEQGKTWEDASKYVLVQSGRRCYARTNTLGSGIYSHCGHTCACNWDIEF
ncbi:hypothetical protein FS749_016783 [Ceratobasidium sp. UAMH 11750]|nr:hypothetical protein FS749_016783 [Ceratobasidium sp. UAMH 11750]